MAFSFESSQAVVSLMSGGGVGVGDRLDTLDTDLVKKSVVQTSRNKNTPLSC